MKMFRRRFKCLGLCNVMFWLIMLFVMGCSKKEEKVNITLNELTNQSIKVEKKNIEMSDKKKGTVEIKVQMPDFEKIFIDCKDSDNMEDAIKGKLVNKDYELLTHEEIAIVTIEDGKNVIHSDEIVDKLLETELINAINAVTKEE